MREETVPALPVKHDMKVRVICARNHVNFGGREVQCRDGVLTSVSDPDCRRSGENL